MLTTQSNLYQLLSDEVCEINLKSRTINIPSAKTFVGVENDTDVNAMAFKLDSSFNGTSLEDFTFFVNYINANAERDSYEVTDAALVDGEITFTWTLSRKATSYRGNLSFIVCAKKFDTDGTTVLKSINTTVSTLKVLKGIEASEHIAQQYADLMEQWKQEIIDSVGSAGVSEEAVSKAVTDYLKGNPVQAYDDTEIKKEKSILKSLNGESNSKNPYKKILAFGDSIAWGSGSSNGGSYGFLQMTKNTGHSVTSNGFFSQQCEKSGTWSVDVDGCKYVSNSDGAKIGVYNTNGNIPQIPYTLTILYKKCSDGTVCSVYGDDGDVVGTIDCSGDSLLEKAVFTSDANKKLYLKVNSGEKAYIQNVIITPTDIKGNDMLIWAYGGYRSSSMSVDFYKAYIDNYLPNTMIWEFISNDYGQSMYDEFVSTSTSVLEYAINKGIDVILIIPCGQKGTNGNATWIKYKQVYYDFIKNHNKCTLIDYDSLFGGFDVFETKNDYLSDNIHPNDKGYIAMANVLCNVLYNTNVLEYSNKTYFLSDFRYPYHGKVTISEQSKIGEVYLDNAYKVVDSPWVNGWKLPLQASFYGDVDSKAKALPKGNIVVSNFNNLAYTSTSDSSKSYSPIMAHPYLPNVSSVPADNDKYLGNLFRLSIAGLDDQIITYISKSDGSKKWVALQTKDIQTI